MESSRRAVCAHRLHYRWCQLEQDQWEDRLGSPSRPHPKPDRVIHVDDYAYYDEWPSTIDTCPIEQKYSSQALDRYETLEYNTFQKSGALKLTEIELYFLSSFVTIASAHEWLVVYLGVGNGERFRYLRDQYFPSLAVIAYDPIDEFYTGNREKVAERARLWSNDGTNFEFRLRCFGLDEVAHIEDARKDKKLLLISDIRGVALMSTRHGSTVFDSFQDNELQAQAIRALRPVSSLLKFASPNYSRQFYYYLPGVLLMQTFQFPDSQELRLQVDGVPTEKTRYNNWAIIEKHMFHHRHMRGLVYESSRHQHCTACIDSCFDCSILWDTISTYAAKNGLEPHKMLDDIMKFHVYSFEYSFELNKSRGTWFCGAWSEKQIQQWWDVLTALTRGYLMDAIAALEIELEDDADTDWSYISNALEKEQPGLASRLKSSLPRPATRADILQVVRSLSIPLTILRSDSNGLVASRWKRIDWMARYTKQSWDWDSKNREECRQQQGCESVEVSSPVEACADKLDNPLAKKART